MVIEPSRSRSDDASSGRRRLFPIGADPRPRPGTTSPEDAGEPGSTGSDPTDPAGQPPPKGSDPVATLPEDTQRILRALRTPAAWVGPDDRVLWAHPSLEALRITRRKEVRVAEITRMVDLARSTGQPVQQDMSVRRPGRRQPQIRLRVRVSPMAAGAALALIEDISEAERLDHVRRDFVANVSHELKTPVGALSLLAEAVSEAHDDPEAVQHFSGRMLAETKRLTTLINDLMDLSRIEGIDAERPMEPVSMDDVVAQACDDAQLLAQEHRITFLRGGRAGLSVLGVEPQLVAAVRNLIINAINYSPPSTKVAITTGLTAGWVTIAVTDQGIGIPQTEIDRIFERFYRVDPARSRDTGGTGLGLAIVKHVCANHGGDCDVWSRVGEGSTFTMRLPPIRAADRQQPGRKHRPTKEES